jgi:hypothetical protein
MLKAMRDEQARQWRDIPDADFPTSKAIDFKLEEIQNRIVKAYPAEFASEERS